MRIVRAEDVRPLVRICNFNRVEGVSSWGPRFIEDPETILITAGRFSYESASEAAEVSAGELLFIPSGVQHTFAMCPGVGERGFWYMHLELIHGGSWAEGDYCTEPIPQRVTDVSGDRDLEGCFRRCSEVLSGYGRYRQAMLESAGKELWLRLAEHWTGQAFRKLSPRTQEMVTWLREHLTEPLSRRDLAARYYVTPEHINATFKKELGISPTQFIHRERVFLANRLMVTEGLNVKEAAARVGFCDQFYFSKVFKKVMGVPPSRA